MIRCLSRLAPALVTLFGWLAGSEVLAQGNIFNPYGNSGYADYREFGSTKFGNDSSLPGQARIESGNFATGNRYNQFESYSNSLDGSRADELTANRGALTGVPYYRAGQLFDKQNKRAYRPNEQADRVYRARLAERNAAYVKALETKDPRERARLLRALDQDAANRPLSNITAPAATARATQPGAAGRTTPPRPATAAVGNAPGAPARPATAATPPRSRTATTPTPAAGPVASPPIAPLAPAPSPAPSTNPASVPVPAPGPN